MCIRDRSYIAVVFQEPFNAPFQIIFNDKQRQILKGMITQISDTCLLYTSVDRLIQDNYVKQMLIRENQLKVLQNQINPHFLFNTLQTINWKARENHQETISQITEALGRLLRYTCLLYTSRCV